MNSEGELDIDHDHMIDKMFAILLCCNHQRTAQSSEPPRQFATTQLARLKKALWEMERF